jgi:hypothetical protein
MFGTKQDDCDRLCAAGDALKKAYEQAQQQFQKALVSWEPGQAKRELLAARLATIGHTASHDTPDFLMRSRETSLQQQLEAEIRAGDSGIVPAAALVESTKRALFKCNSAVAGGFASWAGRVIPGLPAGSLRDRLEAARHKVEQMYLGRTSEIVDLIRPLIDQVEDDSTVDCPLFRFSQLITQAMGNSTASS